MRAAGFLFCICFGWTALVNGEPARADQSIGSSVTSFLKSVKEKLKPPSCSTKPEPPLLVDVDPKEGKSYCCPQHDILSDYGAAYGCGNIFPCEPYYPNNPCRWYVPGEHEKIKSGCNVVTQRQDWSGIHAAYRKAQNAQAKARFNRPCCISAEGKECVAKELTYYSHERCSNYCGKEFGAGLCEELPAKAAN